MDLWQAHVRRVHGKPSAGALLVASCAPSVEQAQGFSALRVLARAHLLPASFLADILPAVADALVVLRVQRKDALEDALGLRDLPQAPEAQPVAVQAAQERPVVEPPPGQEAVEAGRQRELADLDPDLVVVAVLPKHQNIWENACFMVQIRREAAHQLLSIRYSETS